jgi:hypothetical protein
MRHPSKSQSACGSDSEPPDEHQERPRVAGARAPRRRSAASTSAGQMPMAARRSTPPASRGTVRASPGHLLVGGLRCSRSTSLFCGDFAWVILRGRRPFHGPPRRSPPGQWRWPATSAAVMRRAGCVATPASTLARSITTGSAAVRTAPPDPLHAPQTHRPRQVSAFWGACAAGRLEVVEFLSRELGVDTSRPPARPLSLILSTSRARARMPTRHAFM